MFVLDVTPCRVWLVTRCCFDLLMCLQNQERKASKPKRQTRSQIWAGLQHPLPKPQHKYQNGQGIHFSLFVHFGAHFFCLLLKVQTKILVSDFQQINKLLKFWYLRSALLLDANHVTGLLCYPIMFTLKQNQNKPGYKHIPHLRIKNNNICLYKYCTSARYTGTNLYNCTVKGTKERIRKATTTTSKQVQGQGRE